MWYDYFFIWILTHWQSVGGMGMEGAVVKISAGANDHDLHAMYKVNVEDLSQLLAYHEVFGKLNSEQQQQQLKVINEATWQRKWMCLKL